MTYPPTPIHIPTAGQAKAARDHARGTQQLRVSLLAVWISRFGEAHKNNPKAMALYKLVAKPLLECMPSCGAGAHQKQSSAVMRRATDEITLVERIRINDLGPHPETIDQWASWLLALDAIAMDAWTTWAGTERCWLMLNESWLLLVEWLHSQAGNPAKAEVRGTRIYERAMEGAGWLE